jgi:hypothetical protein
VSTPAQWTTPTFEIVWTRVGPSFGTYPNRDGKHPWHVIPERCEHGVIVGIHCSGCHSIRMDKPVLDWNPRSLAEPTVNHISGKLTTKPKRWKRDPIWHGYEITPWKLTGQVWPFAASSDGKWDEKTEEDVDKLTSEHGLNTTLDNDPKPIPTFAQALDEALDAEHTTTSLEQEVFDNEGHTVEMLDIMVAGSFTQQTKPSSEFFNGWRLHDPNIVAMPFLPKDPSVIIEQYVLRAQAKFDDAVKAKRIAPEENRNQAQAAILRRWTKGIRSPFPVVQKALERMQCANEDLIRRYRSKILKS